MGEKFSANPATGTGSVRIPIATSAGRSGFGPQLALHYDTGNPTSAFGQGWSLGLPAITRRTSLMLPEYRDADESDVFLLAGAEDLVPVRNRQGARDVLDQPPWAPGYRVARYRPRVEGLFARIERWTAVTDGQVHWRSITPDNVTSVYGGDSSSRIADLDDPTRVFSWLISASWDDRGNVMTYSYKAEDATDVDPAAPFEASRSRGAGRHLKRIRYGNRTPYWPTAGLPADGDWMFEVVLDYGDHDQTDPAPTEQRPWTARRDPFSSYRSGFEVRTHRLCRRILMFHHFPAEPDIGTDFLVSATELVYAAATGDPQGAWRGQPGTSLLAAVTHRGYRRDPDGSVVSRAMPPVELEYSPVSFHDFVADVDPGTLSTFPAGLATPGTVWVDLDGEGIAGPLVEQAGGWTYRANRGGGRFAPAELLPAQPSGRALGTGGRRLADLAGTGTLDVIDDSSPAPGFWARTDDGRWAPFRSFDSRPTVSTTDPNVRMLDVTGDGLPDLVLSEGDALTFYPSLGPAGFGPGCRIPVGGNEERGPRVVFADAERSVLVADMSGDGLADLVRVRNGEVCYWPGMGRRFGAKVTMGGAPWFDTLDGFDPRYLQMADIDGSGTTDLVYLGRGGARVWLNQAGNAFADPVALPGAPPVDSATSVTVIDFLGTGTPCLVWSSPLPGDRGHAMRYVDLLDGTKPYLLIGMRNNLGAETRVHYRSSTEFYLADSAAHRPWPTKLPFPVHVVDEVTVYDRISHNRFTTTYTYSGGYWNAHEREFGGFAQVVQTDAADIEVIGEVPASNLDPIHSVPPVCTRTWFHTGASRPGQPLTLVTTPDRYQEPGLDDGQLAAMRPVDTALPATVLRDNGDRDAHVLTAAEAYEAARALRGSVLRQEVRADDGDDQPFQVVEHGYTIELLQPLEGERHAVCVVHPRDSVTFAYERTRYERSDGAVVVDPRVTHELALELDPWGNALRSVAVAYPRRQEDPAPELGPTDREALHAAQGQHVVTATETDYADAIDDGPTRRGPRPAERRSVELIQCTPGRQDPRITNLFTVDELRAQLDAALELPLEDVDHIGVTTAASYRRLLGASRTVYRADDLTGPLPLRTQGRLGLEHSEYTLAFTAGLLAVATPQEVLRPDAGTVLGEGGYRKGEDLVAAGLFPAADPLGRWWTPSGQVGFSPGPSDPPAAELVFAQAHFFRARRFTDPFGEATTLAYDSYDLLASESVDPLGNRTTVGARNTHNVVDAPGQDYRVLAPRLVTDPNRNRRAVAHDALGLVAATAVLGKEGSDTLDGVVPDLDEAAIAGYRADPLGRATELLGGATTRIVYDVEAYRRTATGIQPQPVLAAALARESHAADLPAGAASQIQQTLVYTDGFGRDLQHRSPAPPGAIVDGGPMVPARWVVSGWTIYNNKGKPVRRYEPFFATDAGFEGDRRVGVSPVLFYDPLDRVVATYLPDDSYRKVVVEPWRTATWDGNDTVLLDPVSDPDVGATMAVFLASRPSSETWYTHRAAAALGPDEQDAATKTSVHRSTPTLAHHDPLGRPVLTVEHDRRVRDDGTEIDAYATTRLALDVEGNHRAVTDPLGRVAQRSDFAPGGRVLRTASVDAGTSATVPDVAGHPIRALGARGHLTRLRYDELRRPVRTYVTAPQRPEVLRERIVYGEALELADAEAANLRTRAHRVVDGAGLETHTRHDLDGNLTEIHRRLATDHRNQPDWTSLDSVSDADLLTELPEGLFDLEDHVTTSVFDALGRISTSTAPDGSTTRTSYDTTGHIRSVDVRSVSGGGWTPFLVGAEYNARGQRTSVTGGNGVTSTYDYDLATFRLIRLRTDGSQDLTYHHDPVGNITRLADRAQPRLFYAGAVVAADRDYTYDARYRLVAASGREHIGQAGAPSTWNDVGRTNIPPPTDGQAIRRYTETYDYDAVGNLVTLAHRATSGDWTRTFAYDPSNNRLATSSVGATIETFAYDAHGNTIAMPHLPTMSWDDHDRLLGADLGGGGTLCHSYDAGGQRVRKVVDRQNGTLAHERVYLGGFELYREYAGDGTTVDLERTTLHVMAGNDRIALLEVRTVGDGPGPDSLSRYQYTDHLGSSCVELDDATRPLSYEEYFPYGSTAYQAVAKDIAPKRYRFTGKERDEETGFSYHGARYYSPWLGRWASPDPAGFRDGPNLYVFVRDAPTNRVDPDGLQSVFGAEGAYQQLPSQPNFTREHLIPGSWLQYKIEETFGKDISRQLAGRTYKNAWTVLFPNSLAQPKTSLDLSHAAELRLSLRSGRPVELRNAFLLSLRNTQAGGRLSAEDLQKMPQIAARELASYVKQEGVARDIRSGTPAPRVLAPRLVPPTPSTPTSTPEQAVPVVSFPKKAMSSESTPADGSPPTTETGAPSPGFQLNPAAEVGALGRAVPFVVEAEATLAASSYLAMGSKFTAPLSAPLGTAAEALPAVAGVGLIGAATGHAAQYGAERLGASEQTAKNIGLGSAVITGAAIGSAIIPGVGTIAGGLLGAGAAGLLYWWTSS